MISTASYSATNLQIGRPGHLGSACARGDIIHSDTVISPFHAKLSRVLVHLSNRGWEQSCIGSL